MRMPLHIEDTKLIWMLVVACSSLVCSVVLFGLNRIKAALVFLMLFAAGFFLAAVFFDPFLNLWDERFHVLVARNMIGDPFMPMLYNDFSFAFENGDWSTHKVWLHKQPWFMWQMALSMFIFGAHEWAARLPDVVLGICLIPVFYRTGYLLQNKNSGYLAAFFWTTSGFLPELISGRQMLDHNDFVFIAYVSFSVWCFVEYYFTNKKKWIYLVGVFAGIAVLCKWLPGLFVFLVWALVIALNRKNRTIEIRRISLAVLITCAVAAPWQVYTFLRFPDVASAEYAMNARHFFEVIEGHDGPANYHLLQMNLIYGRGAMWVIPGVLLLFLWRKEKNILGISMVISVVFVYVFFSLAKTKMPAFTAVAMMPVLLIVALMAERLYDGLKRISGQLLSVIIISVALVLLTVWRIDPVSMAQRHGLTEVPEGYWKSMKHNASLWRQMHLPENVVIFNASHGTFLECMFYTGRSAYGFLPEMEHLQQLQQQGLVALIIDAESIDPPSYYAEYNVIFDYRPLMKDY